MSNGAAMKVILDPGHGGKALGATFDDVREKDITMLVCYATKALLEANGIEVILTRDFDYYLSLGDRVNKALGSGAAAFVSVHTNADPDEDGDGDPEAKGEEIWVPDYSIRSERLARTIMPCIDAIMPNNKFRGIKRSDGFYLLRMLKYHMPVVLIELGFIDNVSEHKTFSNPAFAFDAARLITKGIIDYEQVVHHE